MVFWGEVQGKGNGTQYNGRVETRVLGGVEVLVCANQDCISAIVEYGLGSC